MALFTTALLTFIAALPAAAVIPNGVSHKIQRFDRRNWIVAGDYKFIRSRTLFSCLIANYQR
jgi:hypothetical protein